MSDRLTERLGRLEKLLDQVREAPVFSKIVLIEDIAAVSMAVIGELSERLQSVELELEALKCQHKPKAE